MGKVFKLYTKVGAAMLALVIAVFLVDENALVSAAPPTEKKCSDGVDNDLDGFTDADDPDCDGGSGGDGGGKGGGQGGGESSLRLCASFNERGPEINYIDQDAALAYCDGTDGEILIDTGLKFSTSTRNTEDRRVSVYFQGSSCGTTRADGSFDGLTINQQLNTFFANAQSTEYEAVGGCAPVDPFGGSFGPEDVDSLACLSDTGVQLPVREMRESDGTRYMSMRVNLTDPNAESKKGGNLLVLTFAEDLGQNICDIGASALPVAIACTAEDGESCSEWHFKAFRACAFDYDTGQGGNWRFGGNSCPVGTDITFTVKP